MKCWSKFTDHNHHMISIKMYGVPSSTPGQDLSSWKNYITYVGRTSIVRWELLQTWPLLFQELVKASPKLGSTLGQIEDLTRVEQPLEDLHELGTLIASTLWIDEHQQRLVLALGEWLHLGNNGDEDGDKVRRRRGEGEGKDRRGPGKEEGGVKR